MVVAVFPLPAHGASCREMTTHVLHYSSVAQAWTPSALASFAASVWGAPRRGRVFLSPAFWFFRRRRPARARVRFVTASTVSVLRLYFVSVARRGRQILRASRSQGWFSGTVAAICYFLLCLPRKRCPPRRPPRQPVFGPFLTAAAAAGVCSDVVAWARARREPAQAEGVATGPRGFDQSVPAQRAARLGATAFS